MTALRWAAAAATLSIAVFAGCAPTTPPPAPAPAAVEASPERAAALREQYVKTPGVTAGVVEAVTGNYAAVDGLDPKVAPVGSPVTFFDVSTNDIVCHGLVHSTSASGRLVVSFTTEGEVRAPRRNDLCVKLVR